MGSILAEPAAADVAGIPLARSIRAPRMCVICDDLSLPYDEGVKKFTASLGHALASHAATRVLATRGTPLAGDVVAAPAGRTFASLALRREIMAFDPDIVLYTARGSATFASFLRARVLARLAPRATIALFGFQRRPLSRWQRALIRRLPPDIVFVQSAANRDALSWLPAPVRLIRSGVDLEQFRPRDELAVARLRRQHGLALDRPVVLHVGHLQAGRGVDVLERLAAFGCWQVVLVASSSTPQEAELAGRLRAAGVMLVTHYVPRIEELYQLADCYVFPVASSDNAIDLPLSVLEALACDLPVVATRYGGLDAAFATRPHPGLVFVDDVTAMTDAVGQLLIARPADTRSLALPFGWDAIARDVVAGVLAARGRHDTAITELAHSG